LRTGLPGTRNRWAAISLATLLLMVVAGSAAYQAPLVSQGPGSGSFRVSVDVALVVLHATVTDHQGSLVSNLGEQDFQVFENGAPQQIRLFINEDVPVTVGLVIDHSTTMHPKIAEVVAAARAFAQSSNSEDEMFVVNFHEIVSLDLPLATPFTHSVAELQAAIMNAPTGGQTALYDAVAKGLEELHAGTRDKKVLIVVSDGGDNASRRRLEEVMKLAEESSAVIYTIGLFDEQDPDRNPGVLKRLAGATGGETFLPNQLGDVVAISERIARDIRHQYTIGYVPANRARDGSFRAIRVLARTKDQGKLSVRTRTGYVAGREPRLDEKRAN
jgi:Ca-activated chloride channel family protein